MRGERLDVAQLGLFRFRMLLVVDDVTRSAQDVDPVRLDLLARVLAVTGGTAHRPDSLQHVLRQVEAAATFRREPVERRVGRLGLLGVTCEQLLRRIGRGAGAGCSTRRSTTSPAPRNHRTHLFVPRMTLLRCCWARRLGLGRGEQKLYKGAPLGRCKGQLRSQRALPGLRQGLAPACPSRRACPTRRAHRRPARAGGGPVRRSRSPRSPGDPAAAP